jgi:sulfur carrier protein ThiS
LIEVEVRVQTRSGHQALASRWAELAEGATIDGLLRHLSGPCGFDVRDAIVEDRSYFLVVNGAYCDASRCLDRRLENGDSVAVLPLVAGG